MSSLPQTVVDHLREALEIPDLTATHYKYIGMLGHGGMGAVYLVEDTRLNRRVAMKVLNGAIAPESARRMWQEARVIASLEHPGIIPIHDAGALADGRVFYTMKFVNGRRLDEYASAAGTNEILRVFQRICETVAFAHAHGVIHRDLKPQNIMVGAFGEVLVLDWGIAKVVGSPDPAPNVEGSTAVGTACGTVIGTPEYMAPEQAVGNVDRVDARADVYALGCILARLLAGRRPGARLASIAARARAASREARYPGAAEMSEDVDRFLAGEPVSAYRETLLDSVKRIATRNRTLIALVGAYLLMRAALFYFIGH